MHRWAAFLLIPFLWLAEFHPLAITPLFAASLSPQTEIASTAASTLTPLVQSADLIVRGQVIAVHSFWNSDHSLIESEATLAVAYSLLGEAQATIRLRSAGGFLAAEGIGMVSLHEAQWTVGEEIIAFAYRQDDVWRTVGGATGKFAVQQRLVSNQDLALAQPLAGFLPTLLALIQRRGGLADVPTLWRHLSPDGHALPMTAATPQQEHRKWATPHAATTFTINLNTQQINADRGTPADFRQAIIAAASSWSQVPGVDFTLRYGGATSATHTSYNGVNEVLFMHKGAQERAAAAQVWFTADGTIIEADIWINDDYVWNATGRPAADQVDLQSALVHEFGHWLILGHCTDSHAVMFAKLNTGTLKRELQASDMMGIRSIYT